MAAEQLQAALQQKQAALQEQQAVAQRLHAALQEQQGVVQKQQAAAERLHAVLQRQQAAAEQLQGQRDELQAVLDAQQGAAPQLQERLWAAEAGQAEAQAQLAATQQQVSEWWKLGIEGMWVCTAGLMVARCPCLSYSLNGEHGPPCPAGGPAVRGACGSAEGQQGATAALRPS